jgi:cytochrome c-type biogenesis protein CcmH/NrfG
MKTRISVALIAAVLVLYIVVIAQWAWLLLTSGSALAVVMGVALFVLPVIAAWAIGREIWFGVRAEQVGRRLEKEGGLPDDHVAVHPSGRVVRADGDAVFPHYRDEAQAHPDDWRAWYRLGLAYDAAGDRKRARGAIRQSIKLESADKA